MASLAVLRSRSIYDILYTLVGMQESLMAVRP